METAIEKHRRYLSGDFHLTDIIEKYLSSIENYQHLNAFIRVFGDEARQRAKKIDEKQASGMPLGKLAGTVIALKDNLCVKDQQTTCGSLILSNFVPPYDATVVKKIEAEDGLIIGKTNLDQFAMGSSNENSYFGAAKNPHNPERVAGGSSGGSAISVAAGMADLALGSDTGGSIRQPAAFCGVVGLKPTYGLVSRYGLVAFASSLDQIGPFGKTVEDTAMMLNVIAGPDSHDSTCLNQTTPDFLSFMETDVSEMTIGVPKQNFQDGLDGDIKSKIISVIERLKESGITVKEVDLPLTEYAIAAYYIIATAEASSNLARYDGVRYGYRAEEVESLQDMYINSRSKGFGEEVKRRIMLGTYVLSSGYYDAYYKKAQQVRKLIKDDYDKVLQDVDVLLTPTTPTAAFKLGEKICDPLEMYLSDIYTVTANLAGICAISIPSGTTQVGLPIGLQLIAGSLQEEKLFSMGGYLEKFFSAG